MEGPVNQGYASYALGETRPSSLIDRKVTLRNEPRLRAAQERCTQAALALAVAYDALCGAEREKSAADAAYRDLLII